MKLLFDFFPILLFFAAYKGSGDDLFFATAVAIVASAIQVAVHWHRHKRIENMHLVTFSLLIVFGGATLLLQDELYIKWKPTVINWLFGIAFLASHRIGNRPIVQRMMEQAVSLPRSAWMRLNLIWALFFVTMGFINLYVVYNFDTDTWVNFKLFGIIGLTLLFILAQSMYVARHIEKDRDVGERS